MTGGPVIVDVLTGFLGAGKTSLIRRLGEAGALADTALLVNEYADLPIDQRLLGLSGLKADVLGDTCLCCVIDDDLRSSLLKLLDLRAKGEVPAFSRILIETSGMADPAPLVATLAKDPLLRPRLKLGMVVALADVCHYADTLHDQEEARAQIVAADRILLSKADIAPDGAVEDAVRVMTKINPLAELDVTDPAKTSADIFRPVSRLRPSREGDTATDKHAHSHDRMATIVLRWPEALDWAMFASWLSLLLHRHGRSILRIKGVLLVAGEEQHGPLFIQCVRHVVHEPEHCPDETAVAGAEIVMILRDIDPDLVRRSFEAFMARAATPAMPKSVAVTA